MAQSNLTKHAKDQIPFCADQGIPDLVGAAKAGVSIQHKVTTMPAGGVIDFAAYGMQNMASSNYAVIVINHTSAGTGTVAAAARTPTQITITGPTTADEIDIIIIGQLDGQLA